MLPIILKLSPIYLFFGIGIILKQIKFTSTDNADFLLKLVFFVTLPALVLLKLSETPLTYTTIYLPLISIIINVCCMVVTLLVTKATRLPRKTLGAMLASTMIANNVFMFPFIIAAFGSDGFTKAVLFDFGNSLSAATITYMMVFRYGPERQKATAMIIKLFRSPLFLAFIVAIGMSLFSVELPEFLRDFLEGLGQMTSPLILIALGIFFQPRITQLKLDSLTILIRVGVGLTVGVGLATLFGLTGQTFAVVTIVSAAPVGFMALTFASIAQLDKSFASEVVSVSILLGIIYVPILMILLKA